MHWLVDFFFQKVASVSLKMYGIKTCLRAKLSLWKHTKTHYQLRQTSPKDSDTLRDWLTLDGGGKDHRELLCLAAVALSDAELYSRGGSTGVRVEVVMHHVGFWLFLNLSYIGKRGEGRGSRVMW